MLVCYQLALSPSQGDAVAFNTTTPRTRCTALSRISYIPMVPRNNGRNLNARQRKSHTRDRLTTSTRATAQLPTSEPNPSYALLPIQDRPKRRRLAGEEKQPAAFRDHALVTLPRGRHYTQAPNLPAPPGRVGLGILAKLPPQRSQPNPASSNPTARKEVYFQEERHIDSGFGEADFPFTFKVDEEAIAAAKKDIRNHNRHQNQRTAQWKRWSNEVIPKLIPLFLARLESTQSGRIPTITPIPLPRKACSCQTTRLLKITLALWNSMLVPCIIFCCCLIFLL